MPEPMTFAEKATLPESLIKSERWVYVPCKSSKKMLAPMFGPVVLVPSHATRLSPPAVPDQIPVSLSSLGPSNFPANAICPDALMVGPDRIASKEMNDAFAILGPSPTLAPAVPLMAIGR